jgi:hypothetical protein
MNIFSQACAMKRRKTGVQERAGTWRKPSRLTSNHEQAVKNRDIRNHGHVNRWAGMNG